MRAIQPPSVIVSSRSIVVFFLIGALIALAYVARWILIGSLLGIGIGTLLSPTVSFMQRKFKLPRGAGAFVCFVSMLLFVSLVAYLLYFVIEGQLNHFTASLPQLLDSARARILAFAGKYPWLNLQLEKMDVNGMGSRLAETLLHGLQIGAVLIAAVLFVVATALYTAVSPSGYVRGFLTAFPARKRARAAEIMGMAAHSLRQWFFAQLLALSTIGVLTGGSLALVGVQYAAVFGLLTAILDVIPYAGPLMAFVAVTVVTLGSQPDMVPWVIGIFIGIQQVESNLVVPLMMRGRVELPPVPLMALILIMGEEFGLIGALIATPLLSVGRTIYLETWAKRMERDQETEPQLPAENRFAA
jgi:predicted PurR-regulated permease PerM